MLEIHDSDDSMSHTRIFISLCSPHLKKKQNTLNSPTNTWTRLDILQIHRKSLSIYRQSSLNEPISLHFVNSNVNLLLLFLTKKTFPKFFHFDLVPFYGVLNFQPLFHPHLLTLHYVIAINSNYLCERKVKYFYFNLMWINYSLHKIFSAVLYFDMNI